MPQEIINIEQYGDALRSTGYKNIESAVSEIIDNSIEALAKDVFIIVTDKVPPYAGKRCVTEIAFLDNGIGMNNDLVQACLRIGYGTRTDRKGMGRFGVGLPQASLHVCPLVEVYSWQNGIENCFMSYLDIEKIKNGEQKYIDDPVAVGLPEKYKQFIRCSMLDKNFDFSEQGTLVIWKDCDNVSPKTVKPLFDRLEFYLGQKFRYLIQDGAHNIFLINSENENYNRSIMPNDPLFLMKPNLVLGNLNCPGSIDPRNNADYTESLFEPFTYDLYPNGIMNVPVKFIDRKTQQQKDSTVRLKFSVVKREFYDATAIAKNPGGTAMGKHVGKLEGISVIRSGREIDFGSFDFYSNRNEPEHRWWGCEISFTPELDEAFGVSNNKQHVELIKLSDEEYEDDEIKPIWLQLRNYIKETIKAMNRRNEEIRHGTRTEKDVISPTEEIINRAEQDTEVKGASEEIREQKPLEEIREYVKEVLVEQGVEEPTEDIIDAYLLNKVSIRYKNGGRGPFFDYEFGMGVCICTINTDHVFYKNFLTNFQNNHEAKVAFELFIASLIRTIDETTEKKQEMYDYLIQEWNEKLRKYIQAQTNEEIF
ncbi:MAG: ATP-binding protein [Bacillota bacterium]|nr:ATP-binding protein [Bacillota bacterium]